MAFVTKTTGGPWMACVGPHVQGLGESFAAQGCVAGRDGRRYRDGVCVKSARGHLKPPRTTRHLQIQAQHRIAPVHAEMRMCNKMVEGEGHVVVLGSLEEGLTTNNRTVVAMRVRLVVGNVSMVEGM